MTATDSPTGEPTATFVEVQDPEVVVGDLDVTIGAGECAPDPVISGHVVDCTFALDGSAVSMGQLSNRAVAYLPASLDAGDRGWVHAGSRSSPCRVDGSALVCPDLTVWETVPSAAELSVSVDAGEVTVPGAASLRVLPESSRLVEVRAPGWTGTDWAGVFEGVPQRFAVRRTTTGGPPVWGLLRPLPARAPVRVVPLLDAAQDEARVWLSVDDVGMYELVPCGGATADDCTSDPSGTRLHAIEPRLDALVPGHAGAGGIDVIVTGRGFHSGDAFIATARALLDPAARPVVVERADGRELHLPLFTVDPMQSFAEHVAIWTLPHPFGATPFLHCGMHYDDLDCPPGLDEEYLDPSVLGVTNPVFLELDAAAAGFSEPTGLTRGGAWRAFSIDDPTWTEVPPIPPSDASSWRPGAYTNIGVEVLRPWTAHGLLLHEVAHSWFGLQEEYGGPDRIVDDPDRRQGFAPNCASTRADADRLWGDIVGLTDPFASEYEELLRLAGIERTMDVVAATQVGVHAGGECGIKPSATSIMVYRAASWVPVFGPVNRRWVEQIAALWG